MALSHEVVSQFAKLVDNKPKKDEGVTVKGTYKIIGELRGAAPHPEYHNGPKPHRYDPHIAVRYIEKQ